MQKKETDTTPRLQLPAPFLRGGVSFFSFITSLKFSILRACQLNHFKIMPVKFTVVAFEL